MRTRVNRTSGLRLGLPTAASLSKSRNVAHCSLELRRSWTQIAMLQTNKLLHSARKSCLPVAQLPLFSVLKNPNHPIHSVQCKVVWASHPWTPSQCCVASRHPPRSKMRGRKKNSETTECCAEIPSARVPLLVKEPQHGVSGGEFLQRSVLGNAKTAWEGW